MPMFISLLATKSRNILMEVLRGIKAVIEFSASTKRLFIQDGILDKLFIAYAKNCSSEIERQPKNSDVNESSMNGKGEDVTVLFSQILFCMAMEKECLKKFEPHMETLTKLSKILPFSKAFAAHWAVIAGYAQYDSSFRPSFPTNLIRNLVIMLSEKDLETQLQAVIALRNLASLSFIHSLEMNCEGLFASLELVLQKFNKLEVFEIGSSTRQRHRQNEIIASVVELLEAIAEEGKEGNEFKLRKRNSSELGEYGIYPTSLLYEICNSALQNGSLNDEEENKEFLFKEEEEEEEEEEEWTIRQRHIAYIGIEEGKRLVVQSGIIHALLSVLHNALHHMSLFKLTCLKNINLMIVYRILRLMLKLVSNASSPLLRQIMFNEAASEPSSSSSSSASASASATASALSLSSLTIEGLSFPVESPVEATSSEGCLLDILRFVVCSETIRWMRLVCENSCLFEKQCSGCCFSPDRFFKVDGNENKQIPLTPLELHYANVQDEEEEVISLLSQNMLPFPKCLVVSLDILVSVTCSLVKANDEVALKQFGKVFLTANGACLLHCLYFLFAICDTIVRQLPQDQYSASQSFASSSSCNVFSPETIFIKNMHSLLSFLLALINCVVRLSSDVEIEAVASGVISALVEGSEDRCREIVNFGGYPSLLREKDMNCCSSIEHFDYNKLPSESGIQPNVTLCKTAVVYGNTIEIKTNGSLAPIVRRRNNEGHSQLCKLVFEAEQETEYAREVSRTYEEVFQIKQDCFLDSIRLNFDSLLEIRENDVETACWSLLVLANEKITSRILLEKGVVHYLLRVLKHPVLSIQLAVVQIFLLLCKRSPEAEKQLIDNGGLTILSQTLYFCSIDLYKEEGKSLLEYINMLFNKEWNKFSLENGKERRNKSTLKRGSKDEGDHDEVVIAEGEEELAKMLIDTSSQMFVLLSPFVLCQKIMQLFQNLLCSNIQEKEAQNHSSKFVSSIMRNDSFETFLSQSQPESAEVIDIPNSVPMEFLLEDPAFINATAGNEGFVSMSRFSTEDKKSSKFTPTDRLALCRPDIASILLSNNNFTIRSISALLLRTGTADGQLIIAALELLYTLSLSAEDDIVQMAYEETLVPALSCALDLSTKSVYNSLLLTVVANIARAGAVFALKTKVYSKINPFYNQMNRFGVIAQLKQHAMQENEEGEGYIVNSTLALCYLFLNKNSYDINCDVIVSTLMNVLISGDDVSKLNALVAFNCYQINEEILECLITSNLMTVLAQILDQCNEDVIIFTLKLLVKIHSVIFNYSSNPFANNVNPNVTNYSRNYFVDILNSLPFLLVHPNKVVRKKAAKVLLLYIADKKSMTTFIETGFFPTFVDNLELSKGIGTFLFRNYTFGIGIRTKDYNLLKMMIANNYLEIISKGLLQLHLNGEIIHFLSIIQICSPHYANIKPHEISRFIVYRAEGATISSGMPKMNLTQLGILRQYAEECGLFDVIYSFIHYPFSNMVLNGGALALASFYFW